MKKKRILCVVISVMILFNICFIYANAEPSYERALVYSYNSNLKADVITQLGTETVSIEYLDDEVGYIRNWHGDRAMVSELTHFFDNQGRYTIAYSDNTYVYITIHNEEMSQLKTILIEKKYPLLGDVTCDSNGYYYIVWGKADNEWSGNSDTIAVSKCDQNGKIISTLPFVTKKQISGDDFSNTIQTAIPFHAGNCSTVITDGVLICSYARLMYNGHQSNEVIAVNLADMSINKNYFDFVSHSFDQRILVSKDNPTKAYFVDHGDAYPRAFAVFGYNGESELFHFGGEIGDNYTNAWLGNVCELDSGIILVAASAKTMGENFKDESKNVFVQLHGGEIVLKNSQDRKGTSGNEEFTDKNILWLTDYSGNTEAECPQAVKVAEDKVAVFWEKYQNEEYIDSYYMLLSSQGDVLQGPLSLGGIRLTQYEQPVYKNGCIYWTTAGWFESSHSNYKKISARNGYIRKLIIGEKKLPFSDTDTSAWFYNSVKYVFDKNIMTGLTSVNFGPSENLARSQFAVILYRLNDEPNVTYSPKFPDVPNGQWYTNAVLWANSIGVVSGYESTGLFGTGDNINREQMAVMMYRYAQHQNYDTSQKADFSKFQDAAKVNEFAKEAMQWAVGSGIITGKDNGTRIDPQGNANRAECATIIMRFMEKYS